MIDTAAERRKGYERQIAAFPEIRELKQRFPHLDFVHRGTCIKEVWRFANGRRTQVCLKRGVTWWVNDAQTIASLEVLETYVASAELSGMMWCDGHQRPEANEPGVHKQYGSLVWCKEFCETARANGVTLTTGRFQSSRHAFNGYSRFDRKRHSAIAAAIFTGTTEVDPQYIDRKARVQVYVDQMQQQYPHLQIRALCLKRTTSLSIQSKFEDGTLGRLSRTIKSLNDPNLHELLSSYEVEARREQSERGK